VHVHVSPLQHLGAWDGVADWHCFCRYSEILDYHNVENDNNHTAEEFVNGGAQ
jgi:hypothetical protein